MKERIYNLTWGETLDTNTFIKSNCSPELMIEAIEKKNELLKSKEYEGYSDNEILEIILLEQGYSCENVTPEPDYVLSF